MVKNRKSQSKYKLERWTITTIKIDMRLWKSKANNYKKCVHSAAKIIVIALERSTCNNKESEWNLLQLTEMIQNEQFFFSTKSRGTNYMQSNSKW